MIPPPPKPTERAAAEITAPKDPAAYRPRPLLGFTFWAMIVLMLVCVGAGVVIADFGPRIFGPKPAARPVAEPSALHEAPAATFAGSAAPVSAPQPATPAADVSQLSARVAILESQQSRASQAAAAALAASVVVEASQGAGPFADELSSLRAISAPSSELQALARLAQEGAPSRTALAASFPDAAARAASAARAPTGKAGIGQRIAFELSRVVSLRRVGDPAGDGIDAVLARAERQVEDGDLDHALRSLDHLPPGAREAMAGWRARAERRAEIDRNADALRARARQTLASQARGGV